MNTFERLSHMTNIIADSYIYKTAADEVQAPQAQAQQQPQQTQVPVQAANQPTNNQPQQDPNSAVAPVDPIDSILQSMPAKESFKFFVQKKAETTNMLINWYNENLENNSSNNQQVQTTAQQAPQTKPVTPEQSAITQPQKSASIYKYADDMIQQQQQQNIQTQAPVQQSPQDSNVLSPGDSLKGLIESDAFASNGLIKWYNLYVSE